MFSCKIHQIWRYETRILYLKLTRSKHELFWTNTNYKREINLTYTRCNTKLDFEIFACLLRNLAVELCILVLCMYWKVNSSQWYKTATLIRYKSYQNRAATHEELTSDSTRGLRAPYRPFSSDFRDPQNMLSKSIEFRVTRADILCTICQNQQ